MRRLKLYILLFGIALALPLGYLVLSTLEGLEREEEAEMRYFAEALFDDMEEELALFVRREERRPIDAYGVFFGSNGEGGKDFAGTPFILGYLQNNPDGSFLGLTAVRESESQAVHLEALREVNERFNAMRRGMPPRPGMPPGERRPFPFPPLSEAELPPMPEEPPGVGKLPSKNMANKYLAERAQKLQARLGKSQRRVERVTPEQLESMAKVLEREQGAGLPPMPDDPPQHRPEFPPLPELKGQTLQAEVDPMQSLYLGDSLVYLFRRIVIGNRVYRQGPVLEVRPFLEYLLREYFQGQPMARFARLELSVIQQGRVLASEQAGVQVREGGAMLRRAFARPFSFLQATLSWDAVPRSQGRSTLAWVVILLAVVVLAGLFTIYQSARVVMDLSERRAGFVSSVTHELKTPLTNIRLYVDMLEQGMANDPERRERYFKILVSETERLSRLIQNVLEFSKLERKQRNLNLAVGDLGEVATEARLVMEEALRQEGFLVRVEQQEPAAAVFDREVMLQVLMNLVENSVKFGKGSPKKEIIIRVSSKGQDSSRISVSDTGPGIERHALKKVFDDFYRVDNSLTRGTQGTGIGLALVRRFVEAMGGEVKVANNDGPGCTFTITLPATRHDPEPSTMQGETMARA